MTTDTTTWSTTLVPASSGQGPSASLQLAVNGGAPTTLPLKGVCYSPQPINGSSALSPSLGDLFWDDFSGEGYAVDGWSALWARDLPNIRALGANTVRVYNMMSRQLNQDGSYPSPWNSGQAFTHESFLDACWNNNNEPLYVLVGIALPQSLFWQSEYNEGSAQTTFWNNVLGETVAAMAKHPAVLGFVIANEVDAANVSYCSSVVPPAPTCQSSAAFWWGQVNALAGRVKALAPGKLVGIANHDDPFLCANAQSLMANCTNVDFWGVNTYQPQSFASVFQAGGSAQNPTPGYAGLTGQALKPVILTEYGFPATGRPSACDPTGIYADASTTAAVASVISAMVPAAFAEPLNLGVYYFEYCDEWWNQSAYAIASCAQTNFAPPNIYSAYGGPPAAGFPNGYWDQDGFGLYATSRGGLLAPNAPIWDGSANPQGPAQPIDTLSARTATVAALTAAYQNAGS